MAASPHSASLDAARVASGSGDLLADRRFAYAEAALAEGDAQAAFDLYEQTLERVPAWLPARLGLGKAALMLGREAEARAAFEIVAARDQADLLGARAFLARMGAEGGAVTPGYVAALFDDYAPRFDAHLTSALDYRAPELLAQALGAVSGARRYARVLDLGCGTGLMAKALAGQFETMDGVDLSPRMLEIARQTGLYTRLDCAEAGAWLAGEAAQSADLVIAADVFCYIENLAPLFREARRVLAPGGIFAFTVQDAGEGPSRVGADLRVHHARADILQWAVASRFVIRHEARVSARRDRGVPVPGALYVLSPDG
ncbi:MAG: SAM-dependent methyltransferase [Methylobacterium sp.]|nr:MAG: SAM-dependent methyltransferase [Methylobacterium sp.]